MARSLQATAEVFRLLYFETTVKVAPSAIELPFSEGRLDFENVVFRYANTVTDAVKDLNLQIEPGKTYFFFQAEDGIRDTSVTGVQTCALPICLLSRLLP